MTVIATLRRQRLTVIAIYVTLNSKPLIPGSDGQRSCLAARRVSKVSSPGLRCVGFRLNLDYLRRLFLTWVDMGFKGCGLRCFKFGLNTVLRVSRCFVAFRVNGVEYDVGPP